MIQYFLKRWYYLLVSLSIYFILAFAIGIKTYFVDILALVFFMRVVDDYFDYKKDGGKRLNEKTLVMLAIIFALLFVTMCIVLYGWTGVVGLVIVGYLVLMNKIEFLKLFCLSVLILFYLAMNFQPSLIWLAYIIVGIVLSGLFSIIKRRKNVCRSRD